MVKRSQVREVVYRILAAATVGLTVAGTAYLCAYNSQRNAWSMSIGFWVTRLYLDTLQEAIENHRQATGRLPVNLADLKEVKDHHPFELDAEGRVVDQWGRSFQYRVEGDRFTLYSFGKDGQPGGDGINADIYPTAAGRPLPLPTLRQFTFDLPTGGVHFTCIAAGACAGLVCLQPSGKGRRTWFLIRVGATAVGAVVVAVIISVAHIPSGH